jgi:GT2 family glycosyltransferase
VTQASVGVVVIGRNEGERLRRCLASVPGTTFVVYVDSGSTDASIAVARESGAHVVQLDLSIPFTAARARNEGFHRLITIAPHLRSVQFVDGDCEVVPGWLSAATSFLESMPKYAIVCGRRRERHPEESFFNQLCDWEWDTAVGDAKSCGGDAMVRVEAFLQVRGYRDDFIAGEEPELCVRLRRAGWGVFRLGAEMTLHDAAMKRFDQWWRRTSRAGYAYALGAWHHGAPPERHRVRETARALIWGAAIPGVVTILAVFWHSAAWLLLLVYPLQAFRLRSLHGLPAAVFLVLGKFAECAGALKFYLDRLQRRAGTIIEYK